MNTKSYNCTAPPQKSVSCRILIFFMPKVSPVTVLYYVSWFPLIGRPMVHAALTRCSQRHKCDRCGTVSEIKLDRVVACAAAILTQVGQDKIGGADTFPCPSAAGACEGRLGVCIYPDDSTGGDKEKLTGLIKTLLGLMPELSPVPKEKWELLTQDDIYFCC